MRQDTAENDSQWYLLLKSIQNTPKNEEFKAICQKEPKKCKADATTDIPWPPRPGQNSWTHTYC